MRMVVKPTSALAVLVFALGALSAPEAFAQKAFCKAMQCPATQTRVLVDKRTCKATRRRPAITRARACCQRANGKIKCKKWPKCPKKSPSTACT